MQAGRLLTASQFVTYFIALNRNFISLFLLFSNVINFVMLLNMSVNAVSLTDCCRL